MKNQTYTHRSLTEAVASVMEQSAKVPQKFIDHARKVGSTPLFAELTHRNWSKRGLTDQQMLDKISKHGEEQKKEESVEELDEDTGFSSRIINLGKDVRKQADILCKSLDGDDGEEAHDAAEEIKNTIIEIQSYTVKVFRAQRDEKRIALRKESVELEEAYKTKYPETMKVWKYMLNTGLDADGLEDLLFTMASYYSSDDNDFGDEHMGTLGKNLLKAAKDWHNRPGN